jgi:hypothetical protein
VSDLRQLQHKLLEAGRLDRPSDSVPYAFEKRVMARIRALPKLDDRALWNRVLWQAVAPSLAAVFLLGAIAYWDSGHRSGSTLEADLEDTVLAPFDSLSESW